MRRDRWVTKNKRKKELAAQNYQFHRGMIAIGVKLRDRKTPSKEYSFRGRSDNNSIYGLGVIFPGSTRGAYVSGLMPLIIGFSTSDVEFERGLL